MYSEQLSQAMLHVYMCSVLARLFLGGGYHAPLVVQWYPLNVRSCTPWLRFSSENMHCVCVHIGGACNPADSEMVADNQVLIILDCLYTCKSAGFVEII